MRDDFPLLKIQIVGVNEFGQNPAGANALVTANRTLPWLQDVDSNGNQRSDVWYDSWGVTYRDVIILNGQNSTVDVYNLTANDLGVAANYATMREKLIDAAMAEQQPWRNHRNRFDVNDDGFVVPGDVLIMINEINDKGPRKLPPPTGTSLAPPFWDVNGDNFFSPVDILQVINFFEGFAAEGEAPSETLPMDVLVNDAAPTTNLRLVTEFELFVAGTVEVASHSDAVNSIAARIVSPSENLLSEGSLTWAGMGFPIERSATPARAQRILTSDTGNLETYLHESPLAAIGAI